MQEKSPIKGQELLKQIIIKHTETLNDYIESPLNNNIEQVRKNAETILQVFITLSDFQKEY